MAYDPEARETSNNAMIIGIVVLVLLIGGALAYFATRTPETPETGPAVVINRNAPPAPGNTVIQQVPVPAPNANPDVVVVQPGTDTVTNTTKTIERETVIQPPANNAPAPNAPKGDTNVTVNNAPRNAPGANRPAPNAPPANAPADNAAPAAPPTEY